MADPRFTDPFRVPCPACQVDAGQFCTEFESLLQHVHGERWDHLEQLKIEDAKRRLGEGLCSFCGRKKDDDKCWCPPESWIDG